MGWGSQWEPVTATAPDYMLAVKMSKAESLMVDSL